MLRILVLKEKKDNRVCLNPIDVKKLVENKIIVTVQKDAGRACGYSNEEYATAGAQVVNKITKEIIDNVDIIATVTTCKDKGILALASPNQFFWGYQFLVNNTKEMYLMLKNNNSVLGVEAINNENVYEYLIPNEKIKGSYAPILAGYYLSKVNKNSVGCTINAIESNQNNATFLILNYSYAGYYAAIQSLAMGANVIYLDDDADTLHELAKDKKIVALTKALGNSFKTNNAKFETISEEIKNANVVIATNQLPTVKTAPKITAGMLQSMPKGSVFVDLSVETGFSCDTETKPANLSKQVESIGGVTCVTIEHIADLFAKTASDVISELNTKYFISLNNEEAKDIHKLITNDPILSHCIMTYRGNLTNREIATSLSLKYTSIKSLK